MNERPRIAYAPTPIVKRRRLDALLGLHTGGLPGLLAQGDTFGKELA